MTELIIGALIGNSIVIGLQVIHARMTLRK